MREFRVKDLGLGGGLVMVGGSWSLVITATRLILEEKLFNTEWVSHDLRSDTFELFIAFLNDLNLQRSHGSMSKKTTN